MGTNEKRTYPPSFAKATEGVAGHQAPRASTGGAPQPLRGRGASDNPPNRFEHEWRFPDPDLAEAEEPAPTTQFLSDNSQTIISTNDSPDGGNQHTHGWAYGHSLL